MTGKGKRQRTMEARSEIRRRPRTISDIDEDLEQFDFPLFKSISKFVCEPCNKETTVRLMRHLIVEQVISADSIDGIVAAFRWIVRDWSCKPAFELFLAFCDEFVVASRLESTKYREIALRRLEQFRNVIIDTLKAKVSLMLAGESPTKERKPEKRPLESLPTIPEEDQDSKEAIMDQS